jgi:hypothetical protein
MKIPVNIFLLCKKFHYFQEYLSKKSKRQEYLYQGSITAAATFLLAGTGSAGIQINKITVFCAPDIFSDRFFLCGQIAHGVKILMRYFFHGQKDMGKWR